LHSLLQAKSIILNQRSELKTLFESLSDDFFEKRQRANAPKEKREEAAVRHQMFMEMDILAQLHIKGLFGEG
tara:strand:- start:108 stop:323 length:216 start_codon:yes stop_codon:yes gene_type:complete